jgi:UDP-glucose 4-epimerase
MNIMITGSQGFIGSYLCNELLKAGHNVIGIDNYSKYGKIVRAHDDHPCFTFYEEDVIGLEQRDLARFGDVDVIVGMAAMIGGISYFHKYAYDLLATNERIMASIFDTAIHLHKTKQLKRIVVLSSSMVFESTDVFPTPESVIATTPPPLSTYGFQKLACEYFCKGANEQYNLPYTIIRPFNCVGVGEDKALGEEVVTSGNVEMMMSHVLPDLINKVVKGQYPLRLLGQGNQVRCYTNGKDIARGIRVAIESQAAENEDFNISTRQPTTVKELATVVWEELGDPRPLLFEHDEPFDYDVQKRVPDVQKATDVLGFTADISLRESVREVIEYVRTQKA